MLDNQVTSFLNSQSGYTTSKPKAFVNWVLFDEQFNYVAASSGFEQVGADNTLTTHTPAAINISKGGYLYIYVSNETPNIDVFFDNLQVTHIRGPILEETHYYPFGLTMAGISSKALAFGQPVNKRKFNGGTELESKEFSNEKGLEWYSTEFRKYDPQIGRFHQIDNMSFLAYDYSPYAFANNNPILLNDPLGLTADTAWKELPAVVVTTKIPKPLDTEHGQVLPSRSKFWDFWEGHRTWQAFPGSFFRHAVDHRGYIIPNAPSPPIKFEINIPPVSFTRINLRAVFNLKNWIKGRFAIYRGKKFEGKLYIGKASTKDGGLSFRYTADEILELEATVIKGLDNIPNNAIALGVEQLIIDLNGGIRGVNVANKIPATVKEIYMIEARHWLSQNLPNWETILKFQ